MRVTIVAGGTGGHFYPGLAVGKSLTQAGHEVEFLIRRRDYVKTLLIREQIPYTSLPAAGLARSLHPKNILVPFFVLVGFLKSFFIFIRKRPATLLVMGGYLSVPPALAAFFLGIPIVLHEQNVKPGLANRVIRLIARAVAVSFPESRSYFKDKATVTGNPVREMFLDLPDQGKAKKRFGFAPKDPVLLVFGGSLGACRINRLMVNLLDDQKIKDSKLQVLHLTGLADEDWVREAYRSRQFPHHVESYCHDMAEAFAASDMIVCRAGASTIAELIATKKPALMIPYPYATGGHQIDNARILERIGSGKMFVERNLNEDEFKEALLAWVRNPPMREEAKRNYDNLSVPFKDAAGHIRDLVLSIKR